MIEFPPISPTSNAPIAVGVSGGPDSMALLHMLCRHTDSSFNIHALIVNHDLRADSHSEAKAVFASIATWDNVIPHILTWEGEKPETGKLEAARNARFLLLQDYCEAHHITELYLGHHMDDQAETFLFRLAKGSGLDGLAGMAERKQLTPALTLVRPLLNISKEELLSYCEQNHIPFIKDPTNENTSYMRARLRESREILEREGLTNQRLATTAKRLLRVRSAMEEMTEKIWDETYTLDEATSSPLLTLDMSRLASYPEEFRVRILQKSINILSTDKPYPPRLEKVERLHDTIFYDDDFSQRTLSGLIFKRKKEKNAVFLHIQAE